MSTCAKTSDRTKCRKEACHRQCLDEELFGFTLHWSWRSDQAKHVAGGGSLSNCFRLMRPNSSIVPKTHSFRDDVSIAVCGDFLFGHREKKTSSCVADEDMCNFVSST